MIMAGVFILAAIWAWKAATYWQDKFLTIACGIGNFLFAWVIPSTMTEWVGVVSSLIAAIGCIAVAIGLGAMFMKDATKAAMEGEDESAPEAHA